MKQSADLHFTLAILLLLFLPLLSVTAQDVAEQASGLVTTGVYEFAEGGAILYARADRDILISRDGGESWDRLERIEGVTSLIEIEASSGGLWAVTDAGLYLRNHSDERWTKVSNSNHHHLYAIDDETLLGTSSASAGLERSTDQGVTWEMVAEGFPLLRAITAADGTIWVTDGTRVLQSADEGKTWSLFAGESGGVPAEKLHPLPNGEILAVGREAAWLSDRESGTWDRRGDLPENEGVFAIFTNPAIPRMMYLGLSTGREDEPTLYHFSADTGRAWTSGLSGLGFSQYQGSTHHAVMVSDSIVLVGLSYGHLSRQAHGFAQFGQIIRSTPGDINGYWDLTFTSSIGASRIVSLIVDPGGTLYAGRDMPFFLAKESSDWIFSSDDGGVDWAEISIGDEGGRLSISSDGSLFVTGTPGVLFRSTDQGQTWDSTIFRGADVRPIGEVMEISNDLLALETVTESLTIESWLSTDGGVVWELTGEHEWFGGQVGNVVDREGRIFTAAGKIVHASKDSGKTWIWRSVAGEHLDYISDIVLLQNNRPLVATTAGRLYTTVDGGNTWEIVSSDLTDTLWALETDDQGTLFGGASNGTIWRSIDDGTTWRPWARIPEPVSEITDLAWDPAGYLYIGTYRRGVWRGDIAGIGDVEREVTGLERLDLR